MFMPFWIADDDIEGDVRRGGLDQRMTDFKI